MIRSMAVLRDVLVPGLRVVFCGTAAGTASARRQAYYAGPGNAFWPALFAAGFTPRQLSADEYATVTDHGLGLTDLAKEVCGQDSSLRAADFDRAALAAKVLRYCPGVLAFTSKRAAWEFLRRPVEYGLLEDSFGMTRLFVLPSPSGAARRYWSLSPWQALARLALRP